MEKRSNKFRKWAAITLTLLAFIAFITVVGSPYGNHKGFEYKLIRHSVEIDAPVEQVYRFLGNSDNVSRWSVYVDHISTLNPDSFTDGTPGSRRRCFCNADESGTRWDELITEVVPYKKRQLTIYNMQGFSLTAENLATEQIYEKLDSARCRITFTVFYKDKKPSFFESVKTYIAAYKIKDIFEENMKNIKRITESEYHG
ncbi:MAG: SRPBCC family protein [Bacteroidota bacterium]